MGTGRTLRRIATGTVVTAGAAALLAGYVLRRPLPKTKGRVVREGLRAPVEIIRDKWGVPHIYAAALRDLFFAVGYAQAQDRLWQMEFNRRLATGRLAEILGEPALEIDRLVRRVGFHRATEQDWLATTEEEQAVLESFTAGVNAYLKGGKLPLEFTILRTRPRPWKPVDTLAFGRFFGWALAGNWDSEITRSWTVERFGAKLMAELEPRYTAGQPLVVPPGTAATGSGPNLTNDFQQAQDVLTLAAGGMSNNWAVDGHKSATGKPLLASDPHLPLSIPSIWWEMHIDSPELKAAGVGIAGLPGILMGHNARIAWGQTAAQTDGDDLFVQQLNPDNPSQYRQNGDWVNGDLVREEIKVRGRERPVVENVLITNHGPVVSPAIKGETRTLSLKTVALEPSHQTRTQLMLMGARDWDEFCEALTLWTFPPLNFGYADVDGNIGYHLAGLTPIRSKGHGILPSPAWTGEYDWTGFVPSAELPHSYNPETHWTASANNKIADDAYPYFLAANYADGFRAQRIIEQLEEKDKLSVEDFKAMQVDQLSLAAQELVPLIVALEPQDESSRRAISFLRAWDYTLAADSVAACVYETFYTHLVRRTLEEKLGSWSDFFMGKGIHPLRSNGSFFNVAHSWLMEKIRERPAWFEGKTWNQVMEESLGSATAELRNVLGDEVSKWRWGRLHKQRFRHPLGEVRALDRVFNRGPVSIGGDANTVWQAAYAPYHGYEVNSFTASWRQIIDLDDFNRSQAVLPTGQSGHPGSRHYADMTGMWSRGEYHPMLWDRDAVEEHARGRLELAAE